MGIFYEMGDPHIHQEAIDRAKKARKVNLITFVDSFIDIKQTEKMPKTTFV